MYTIEHILQPERDRGHESGEADPCLLSEKF